MGLAEAVDILFAVNDAVDSTATIQGYADVADKLAKAKPGEIEKIKLDQFTPKKLQDVLKVMAAAEKTVDAANAGSVEWPDSNTGAAFKKAAEAAKKYGHTSKEALAAIAEYKKQLIAYSRKLADIVKLLRALDGECKARKTASDALAAISVVAITAFEKLTRLPSGQQPEFFALARGIVPVRDIAKRVSTKLGAVQKLAATGVTEGEELIRQNLEWILWCDSGATKSEQSLTINMKAKGRPIRK